MNIEKRKENFIKKSKLIHNNKYDYSKVEYIDSLTKVCIICPIHGEFWQTPQAHARGNSCPLCSNINRGDTFRSNLYEFIDKANKIHNNEYDYSKVEYINSSTKVCITCKKHGDFYMTPSNHLTGQKCPKCSGKGFFFEEILNKAKNVHGDKYDYSKVHYKTLKDKVTIICPIHGEFQQSLKKHINLKHGCPKCGAKERGKKKLNNLELIIKKANEIHNNKYDYSKTEYNGMNVTFKYICPKHGEVEQRPSDHLRGFGCPKCANLESKNENEIYSILKETYSDIEQGNRTILNGKELDIFIPSKNIAIEYNGLRWHSELFNKDKWYHLNKTLECNKNGIKLLQIFEDEYINHKDIVLNKIYHILNIDNGLPKIMGRKCKIKIIENESAKNFLNDYHIQGYVHSTVHLGAIYNDILVGVMSFTKYDKNSSKWTLTRFASDYHYICQGVGGKLFKHFIKTYNPNEIKSFADKRWMINKDNNLYTKLGFKLVDDLKPNYDYILGSNPKTRIHKFNFRKKILSKKYGFSMDMSENEMTNKLGYYKIWNCGLYKFVWYK